MILLQGAKNPAHDILAQVCLCEVSTIKTVKAVAAEHANLVICFVCVTAMDKESLSLWVHQLLTYRI